MIEGFFQFAVKIIVEVILGDMVVRIGKFLRNLWSKFLPAKLNAAAKTGRRKKSHVDPDYFDASASWIVGAAFCAGVLVLAISLFD